MKRLPIHTFFYSIAYAGAAAVAVFLPLGVRWWGFATCVTELAAAVVWCAWAWRWSRPAPVRRRPDYARIALLEHELLGIEPEPGTFAAAAVAMAAFTPRTIRRDRSPAYFAGGYVSGGRTGQELPPMPESWRPVPPPGPGADSPTTR